MWPAPRQDTACSVLRPPNTTATLILRWLMLPPFGPGRLLAWPAARWLSPGEGIEGQPRILDEILGVLKADREPYRARVDPRRRERGRVKLPVRGRRGVADLGVRPAERRGHLGDAQPVGERHARLAA